MSENQTKARDRACDLAPTNPSEALAAAREIDDPWFACQALAWVGRFWPDDDFETIVDEALRIGAKCDDPYRVVASAAWPARALIERGASQRINIILPPLLTLANQIANFGSRSEALFLLFQATKVGGQENWLPVLQELVKASFPTINWRQRRNLRDAILIVAADDSRLARDIQSRLPDGSLKTEIERKLKAFDPKINLLRWFFWK